LLSLSRKRSDYYRWEKAKPDQNKLNQNPEILYNWTYSQKLKNLQVTEPSTYAIAQEPENI